jgi:signal transduction histidine kinase
MAKSAAAKSGRSFDARLEQAKLDAMKELAYGASHEINNPLANISARAQSLLRDEADPERRRALEAIHQQALRAHEMISDLMLFARPPQLVRRPVNVLQLLRAVQAERAAECQRRDIELHVDVEGDLPTANADAVHLAVAVKALCTNAVEAIGRGGRVDVAATLAPGGKSLAITVSDNGPGIPVETRPHIFDPFFSGREAGRGLGFGLPKCWRIVTEHGGTVTVAAGAEKGAVFTIDLPLDGGPAGP